MVTLDRKSSRWVVCRNFLRPGQSRCAHAKTGVTGQGKRVPRLIGKYLWAEVMVNGRLQHTLHGLPQVAHSHKCHRTSLAEYGPVASVNYLLRTRILGDLGGEFRSSLLADYAS
jgi:hypothetical protein